MRTKPLVGTKAWFGPRRLGWGLSPVAPQGWAVVAAAVAGIIALVATGRRHSWIAFVVIAAMLAVVFLKGTSPGGPAERDEFEASQRDSDR